MKKMFFLLFVLIVSFGCQESFSKNEDEINEPEIDEDIFEFKHIDKAPEATEKHPIDEVIKVFFDEWSIDAPYEAVAIDV